MLLIVGLAGCERAVDLGIEEEMSRLVVQSNFQPDKHFEVVLSRSRSVLSNDPIEYIGDANVQIFADGQLLEVLPMNYNPLFPYPVFTSLKMKPQEGQAYTLVAEAPGLEAVSATSSVPQKVAVHSFEVTDISWRMYGPQQGMIQFFFTLVLEFDDPPQDDNFYHLDFFYEPVNFQVDNGDTTLFRSGIEIPLRLSETPNDRPYLMHFDRGILVDDQQQQGERLRYTFEGESRPVSRNGELIDRIYAGLRSVSLDYYHYHTSLTRQGQQTDPLFADPVILYDNVENGYGIFAGYSVAKDSVIIQQ